MLGAAERDGLTDAAVSPGYQYCFTRQLAAGGCLLLSSYSEPSEHNNAQLLEIVKARLRMLGMDEATLELFLSGRNKVVFSLAEELIQQQAQASGCAPPQVLLRAMFNGLWLIQRPAT